MGTGYCGNASKVIALSQTETQQCKDMGSPEGKITVIPNGINLSEYSNLPLKGSIKKKFSINENEKIILYMGRIHRIKGVDILLKAFADVTRSHDAKLLMVGPDDGYLSTCKNLARQLKIEDSFVYGCSIWSGKVGGIC